MHLGQIAVRGSAFALCTASALTLGIGSASASTPTPAEHVAAIGSALPTYRDFCDDWNHRGDQRCRSDRWNWDNRNHRWGHDRWDGHRWNRR